MPTVVWGLTWLPEPGDWVTTCSAGTLVLEAVEGSTFNPRLCSLATATALVSPSSFGTVTLRGEVSSTISTAATARGMSTAAANRARLRRRSASPSGG